MLKKRKNYDNIEMLEITSSKELNSLALQFFNDWKKYKIIMEANKIMFYFEKRDNNDILIPQKEPTE